MPRNIPYSAIEEVARRHHDRLCDLWAREAPESPTPEDLSAFLMNGPGSVIPACLSLNALYTRPLTQSAIELLVNVPARGAVVFEELLEAEVARFCAARAGSLAGFIRPMFFDRPVTVSHRHYGAFVGPRGKRIRDATDNTGKLLWSTEPGKTLRGEFTLWVPKRCAEALRDRIYAAYRDVID